MRGSIDIADRHGIHGWALDPACPDQPVSLVVSVDDRPPVRVLANAFRADLEQAGLGDGRHGFALDLGGLSPLVPHSVHLRHEATGRDMPGSPVLLPAAGQFDDALMAFLSRTLADTDDDAELTRRAGFLAQQADRLLQARADRRAHRPGASAVRRFRVRWTGRPEDAPPEDAQPAPAPRALVIDETLPDPNRDAGSAAILSHVRSLQRLGFAVSFVPSAMTPGGTAALLEGGGVSCCVPPWYGSVEEVLRREGRGFQVVYVHRLTNARYVPLIRHYQPRACLIYSVADLHHLRLQRQAVAEERPELARAAAQVRITELSVAHAADCTITHSEVERALLAQALPKARIAVVPWAVSCRPVAAPFAGRSGIAMVGSFGHAPNLDAAWWLIQDIMPRVRALDPAITCTIAGSGMPDGLRAAVGPGVAAVGFVDDLASLHAQVRLTVAPLAFGAGIKGKVLDSLAAGLPCACSPVAAEGLALPPPLADQVGADADALASVIHRLHADPALNAACAAAGLDYVAARHSEAAVDAALRTALGAWMPKQSLDADADAVRF